LGSVSPGDSGIEFDSWMYDDITSYLISPLYPAQLIADSTIIQRKFEKLLFYPKIFSRLIMFALKVACMDSSKAFGWPGVV
jgi:hypothetical protein